MKIELTETQALILRNYLASKIASDFVKGEKVNADIHDTLGVISMAVSKKFARKEIA